MKENLKKFLQEVGKNEELKNKLAALTDKDTAKIIEIAKEYGFTLTEEDLLSLDKKEFSDDEVDQVSGGRGCFCLKFGANYDF